MSAVEFMHPSKQKVAQNISKHANTVVLRLVALTFPKQQYNERHSVLGFNKF